MRSSGRARADRDVVQRWQTCQEQAVLQDELHEGYRRAGCGQSHP